MPGWKLKLIKIYAVYICINNKYLIHWSTDTDRYIQYINKLDGVREKGISQIPT